MCLLLVACVPAFVLNHAEVTQFRPEYISYMQKSLRQLMSQSRLKFTGQLPAITLWISVAELSNNGFFNSEAKASVPEHQISWVSDWVSNWLSSRFFSMGYLSNGGRHRNEIWRKGSLRDEDDAQTLNTHTAQRKHAIPHSMMKNDVHCSEGSWDMTSVLVTVLGDQLIRCSYGTL